MKKLYWKISGLADRIPTAALVITGSLFLGNMIVGCKALDIVSEGLTKSEILGVVDTTVASSLVSLQAGVDARVAAGEEFDEALKAELAVLKAGIPELVAGTVVSALSQVEEESPLVDLGDGDTSETEGALGLLLLWLIRNYTRQKAGLPSTLLTGAKKEG